MPGCSSSAWATCATAGPSNSPSPTTAAILMTLSPSSTPSHAAQEAAKAGKYDEALARLREADAVPNLTPHEAFLIARLRGFSALGAGDTATAIKAFELVINASETTPDELQRTLDALANTAYRAKDYARATSALERYFKAGGTNEALRL